MRPGAWVTIIAVGVIALVGWRFYTHGDPALVVYCVHDAIYSEAILRDFEQETGIPINIRFDTEATKSLGLTEQLIREKHNPRCDVFWNNEPLGTMQLKTEGVLLPYKGSGYQRIPDTYKDPDGYWVGFAARTRVWIINTQKMPATEDAVTQALQGDLSRAAIAKPLYGTTRMHYTVLWKHKGEAGLKRWHADWRARDINEVMGNATVKNLVATGACDLGLTDTDDFFIAKDAAKPVAMLPARLDDGSAILIPNTVSIIKGTQQLEAAQKLVDFLLSSQTELALARSKSRQIPLGPVDDSALPEDVRPLTQLVESAYPIAELGAASQECLAWLRAEYLK